MANVLILVSDERYAATLKTDLETLGHTPTTTDLVAGAELGAEAANVDVNGAWITHIIVAPDSIEQMFSLKYAATVVYQKY